MHEGSHAGVLRRWAAEGRLQRSREGLAVVAASLVVWRRSGRARQPSPTPASACPVNGHSRRNERFHGRAGVIGSQACDQLAGPGRSRLRVAEAAAPVRDAEPRIRAGSTLEPRPKPFGHGGRLPRTRHRRGYWRPGHERRTARSGVDDPSLSVERLQNNRASQNGDCLVRPAARRRAGGCCATVTLRCTTDTGRQRMGLRLNASSVSQRHERPSPVVACPSFGVGIDDRIDVQSSMDELDWLRGQGVVLQSARGPVPSLAERIVGEPIRGSWWGHPSGDEIYRVLNRVRASPDVVATRLINGKVTLIHRRLWPALVRVADRFPSSASPPLTRCTRRQVRTGRSPSPSLIGSPQRT